MSSPSPLPSQGTHPETLNPSTNPPPSSASASASGPNLSPATPSFSPTPSHSPQPETLNAIANPPPSSPSDAKDPDRQVLGSEEPAKEEEEVSECGFCVYMKSGGCKDPFTSWERCIQEAEETGEDVVAKCSDVTMLLKRCMEAHKDYYEPILQAEQAMADAAADDPALEN